MNPIYYVESLRTRYDLSGCLLWAIRLLTAAGLTVVATLLLLDVITKRVKILAELKEVQSLPK